MISQDRKLERVIRQITKRLKEDAKVELGKGNLPVDISTYDVKNPKDQDLNKAGQKSYYLQHAKDGANWQNLSTSLKILANFIVATGKKGNRNYSFEAENIDNWDFMVTTSNNGTGNQISSLTITDDNGQVVFNQSNKNAIEQEIFDACDWYVKNDENAKATTGGDVNKENDKRNSLAKQIYETLVKLSNIIESAKPDKV